MVVLGQYWPLSSTVNTHRGKAITEYCPKIKSREEDEMRQDRVKWPPSSTVNAHRCKKTTAYHPERTSEGEGV
jgi:hypothetical protein